MDAYFISQLNLGDAIHDDEVTETLLQTMLDDYQGPLGWRATSMFDDLWHFNGDAAKPRWVRAPRAYGPSEWPIAGPGWGWTAAARLWLWTEPREPWSNSEGNTGTGRGHLIPSQLWAFGLDAETWERIDSSVTLEKEWPGPRRGEVLHGGWLFGGIGDAECATNEARSPALQDGTWTAAHTAALGGLWRFEVQEAAKLRKDAREANND